MSTVESSLAEREDGVSRRDFLCAGSLGVVGLSLAEQAASARQQEARDRRSCILLLLTGGPSQFETFDPKPDAPSGIRGPLAAISSAVPGISLSESLPLLAQRANRFAVVRSLYHEAAPIHETGLQLLQTARLSQGDIRYPHFGSVIAKALGPRRRGRQTGFAPPHVILPARLASTGVTAVSQGQTAAFLGGEYEAVVLDEGPGAMAATDETGPGMLVSAEDEPERVRRAYRRTRFGRMCLTARQLVERGVRCVTVNWFDELANRITWDCHGRKPWAPATLADYRDSLCPQFDRAVSVLLDDLAERGLLDDTLVVAAGEFGRTPYVNADGGRDHWPGVWSALVAGAGVPGGLTVGASDAHGGMPAERPIELAELTATIYERLGLDVQVPIVVDGDEEFPLVEHHPIAELLA